MGSKQCGSSAVTGTVPPVRGAFFPLDEELGLRANVAFTPRLEESMVRLSTWMQFRPASRELAFFTRVQMAEATLRQVTEQAGATQVRIQEEQTATLLQERAESPAGPKVELMSLDGCYLQMVGGEWKEVKTVALGVVNEPVEERGEQVVHTRELTYFSRMSESGQFQQAALVEIHERGVEKAETVCAVSDGADWIPKFVGYHRQDAGSCHGVCGASGPSRPRAVALPRGTHHRGGAHQVQTGPFPAMAEAPTTRIECRRVTSSQQ